MLSRHLNNRCSSYLRLGSSLKSRFFSASSLPSAAAAKPHYAASITAMTIDGYTRVPGNSMGWPRHASRLFTTTMPAQDAQKQQRKRQQISQKQNQLNQDQKNKLRTRPAQRQERESNTHKGTDSYQGLKVSKQSPQESRVSKQQYQQIKEKKNRNDQEQHELKLPQRQRTRKQRSRDVPPKQRNQQSKEQVEQEEKEQAEQEEQEQNQIEQEEESGGQIKREENEPLQPDKILKSTLHQSEQLSPQPNNQTSQAKTPRFPILGPFLNNEKLVKTMTRLFNDGLHADAVTTFRTFNCIPDQNLWRVFLQHIVSVANINTFEIYWEDMKAKFASVSTSDYLLLFKALSAAHEKKILRTSVTLSQFWKRWLDLHRAVRSKKVVEDEDYLGVLNIYLQVLEKQQDIPTLQRMISEAPPTNSLHLVYDAMFRIYLKQGDQELAFAVYDEMEQRGYNQVSVATSLSLIDFAASRGRTDILKRSLDDLKQQSVDTPVHSSIFNALLDKFNDLFDSDQVWTIYEVLISRNRLNHFQLRKIVRGLSTTNNIEKVRRLYQMMCTANPNGLTTEQYNAILHGLCSGLKRYKMSGIMELMQSIYKDMTSHKAKALLTGKTRPRGASNGNDIRQEINRQLTASGPSKKDETRGNTLSQQQITSTVGAANAFNTNNLDSTKSTAAAVEEIKSGPDLDTFNAFLLANARIGSLKGLNEVLHEMKSFGVAPNLISYVARILAYSNVKRDPKPIFDLLGEMKKGGIQPNSYLITTLIDAFSRLHSDEGLKHTEDLMKQHGLSHTEITYLALLNGYAVRDDEKKVMLLLRDIKKYNIAPTVNIFNAAIHYLANKRSVANMIQVYKRLQSGESGLAPNVITYNSLIQGFSMAGAFERCLALYEEMKNLRISPNTATFAVMFDTCGFHRHLEHIPGLWKEMIEFGVRPHVNTYTSVMEAYQRSGLMRHAIGVVERMDADKITPSNKTLRIFATFFITHESPEVRRLAKDITQKVSSSQSERPLTKPEQLQFVALREEVLRADKAGLVLL